MRRRSRYRSPVEEVFIGGDLFEEIIGFILKPPKAVAVDGY